MSDQQLYLAIGVPTLISVVNLGVIVTLVLYFANKLETRIDKLETKLEGKIDRLAEDYTRFYGEQRKHDTEIANLKERLKG